MPNFNILHISDLHYKKESDKDIEIVRDALLRDLHEHFFNIKNLKPDFVIFSGDSIYDGDKGFSNDKQFIKAFDNFFNPLLDKLELSSDKMFICCGNHDIQRSKIDNLVESGLKHTLTTNDEINKVLDKIEIDSRPFDRLENFNNFIKNINDNNPNLVNSNILYSTYSIVIKNVKIGIACLNTSWRAYGGDDIDKGNLILGERQINWAINDLKDCDIKFINTHHPISYLHSEDSKQLKFLIPKYFDMLFHGHIHDLNSEFVIGPAGQISISSSGALFEGRQFEGYSFVNYNIADAKVDVHYRRYNKRMYNFIPAEDLITDGILSYDISTKTKETRGRAIAILKDCYVDVKKELCEELLTYKTNTIAPKDFNEIVVFPNLSLKSEYYNKADDDQEIEKNKVNIEDLINTDENIVFLGKKESGKTTILNIFLNHYIENKLKGKYLIPIRIDYNDLPKGKRAILNSVHNFLNNSQRVDIEYLLQEGQCIILFDNFDFEKSKKYESALQFIKAYSQNRYIFTVNEDLIKTLDLEEIKLYISYRKIYIKSFGSNEIRLLTKNWFKNKSINTNEVHESIIDLIRKTQIPSTPLVISIFLWIFERNEDYVPINEATLVEYFVSDLMQKLKREDIKSEKIDFKIKQDYLSNFAHYMILKDSYSIDYLIFEDITIEYFKKRMLTVNKNKFINELFDRGILTTTNNKVKFRFNCFHTYFAAIKIIEDPEFYNFIINQNNYLKFSSEINFYSGLTRKDSNLLTILNERLKHSFKDIEEKINLNDLKNFEIEASFFENYDIESFKKNKPTHEEIDRMYDKTSTSIVKHDQTIKRKEYEHYTTHFIENLNLFSKVLRNSELIENEEDKVSSYEICIKYYGLLSLLIMDYAKEVRFSEHEMNEAELADFRHFLNIIIPTIIQTFMFFILGSPKLDQVIIRSLNKSQNLLVQYFNVFLYADLKLAKYLDNIKNFTQNIDSKIILELSFMKCQQYYYFRNLTKHDEIFLLNIMAEIVLKLQKKPKKFKTQIIDKIKSKKRYHLKNINDQNIALS